MVQFCLRFHWEFNWQKVNIGWFINGCKNPMYKCVIKLTKPQWVGDYLYRTWEVTIKLRAKHIQKKFTCQDLTLCIWFTCPLGTWLRKFTCPVKIFTCPANICTNPVKLMYTAGKISTCTCPDWKITCPVGHVRTKVYVPWDKIYMPWARLNVEPCLPNLQNLKFFKTNSVKFILT